MGLVPSLCGAVVDVVRALARCGIVAGGFVKIPQSLNVVLAIHPLSFQREKKAGGAGKKRWGCGGRHRFFRNRAQARGSGGLPFYVWSDRYERRKCAAVLRGAGYGA